MTVHLNYTSDVDGLNRDLEATLARIDEALDRGDQRAFRMWTMKARSLSTRLTSLLLKIVTAEG